MLDAGLRRNYRILEKGLGRLQARVRKNRNKAVRESSTGTVKVQERQWLGGNRDLGERINP